jgi:RNA methyltransferase, TrmH family
MISKNQIKYIRSLHQKKGRELNRKFIAEGSRLVLEAVEGPYPVSMVCGLSDWVVEHKSILQRKAIHVETVSPGEMERITALSSPGPALAVISMKEDADGPWAVNEALTLILDGIHDPGNLGTIIRIADWFGIRQVICSPDTVELYNPKVIQATMGSFCRVEVHYAPLPGLLSGGSVPVTIYGTFLEGRSIYEEKLARQAFIVIGSESHGISPEVEKFVTDKITIPSFPLNTKEEAHAESLNAAVATAIVCSEYRRQQDV